MNASSTSLWKKCGYWLIDRRSLRAWWAYVLWVLVYLFICALGHEDVLPDPAWMALIPVVFVFAHMIYPTILGWLIILLPTLVYSGFCVFYSVSEFRGIWVDSPGRFIFLIAFAGALLSICVGLFVDRPWQKRIKAEYVT